ncbi:hypothetical protein WA577_001118 [Blastocystis sp. JDR]
MLPFAGSVLRSIAKPVSLQVRCFATIEEKSAKSFKDYMLETVLKKEQENCYATLVSATGSSLLDGYLETHNLSFLLTSSIDKKTDRLLVVSNGPDGDAIAKRALTKGIPTDWACHPSILPMDPEEAAEDVVFREKVTHVIFMHVESFTGAITPLHQIISRLRRVRQDVSLCVDNRSAFCLHPMPQVNEIVDYSINETSKLGVSPAFGFMTAHLPSIIAEAHRHPDHVLSSMYNSEMTIERMVPAVQKKYEAAFAEKSWEVLSYQYEEAKARLVNKVRSLLPLIPFGTDQSCFSSAFLVPQEVCGLRELLGSLGELGVKVEYRFITPGLPSISFLTSELIRFEEEGGNMMDIYKSIEKVTRHRKTNFVPDMNFIKQEAEYRKKQIFGDRAGK